MAVTALASFCIYFEADFPLIGMHRLLSFIIFLMSSDLAVPTVRNHVSAMKSYFNCNRVNIEVSLKLFCSPQQFLQLIHASSQLPYTSSYTLYGLKLCKSIVKQRVFAIPYSPVCHLCVILFYHQILSYHIGPPVVCTSFLNLISSAPLSVSSLNFSPHLSAHAFRRSGASLAFKTSEPFQAIQAYVTWASDSLLAYLDASARDCTVPHIFANFF
jgi:hypothetical protein